MGPVLWQRYWIRHLRRHGRDLDIDMHAPQRGNDAGIEIRDRAPQRNALDRAVAGANHQHVVEQVEFGVERPQAHRDG